MEKKSIVAACVHCFAHGMEITEFETIAREDKGLVFDCELHRVVRWSVPAAHVKKMPTARRGAC